MSLKSDGFIWSQTAQAYFGPKRLMIARETYDGARGGVNTRYCLYRNGAKVTSRPLLREAHAEAIKLLRGRAPEPGGRAPDPDRIRVGNVCPARPAHPGNLARPPSPVGRHESAFRVIGKVTDQSGTTWLRSCVMDICKHCGGQYWESA